MSTPDKDKFDAEEAARKKFEADKALKDAKPPPWPAEAWEAARSAARAGIVRPQPRLPIVITSTGPFSTPQKVQEVAGLLSLPEVKQATRASLFEEEDLAGEKVRYCDVDMEQHDRIREYSDGEKILVWFQGKRRWAWLAHSVAEKKGAQHVET